MYDIIIIGSGPGGYAGAIRASQLGMKVALVEKDKTLGGTCANVGCIPSKALLHASELYHEAGHGFAALGIDIPKPVLNLHAMMKHKSDTVTASVQGVAYLMKKNKVDVLKGWGSIISPTEVAVKAEDGTSQTHVTKNILIATGSEVTPLPGVTIDEKVIVSNTGALLLDKVPAKMIIIGAGVIGLELGSVWRRLGAEVEVIEYLDRILPGMDNEVAKSFQKILEKQGFVFNLGQKVTGVTPTGEVTFMPSAGGAAQVKKADIVLVAIGRRPYTAGLGLDKVGVTLDRGKVAVNDHFETSVKGIYAIGDVVRGPMLAHKAEDEAMALMEMLAGQKPHINYGLIPGVVYTMPEVASVGRTEEELKAGNIAYKAGKFPFAANGRARANANLDGFVKVLADAKTDEVLGVHIIGAGAGEMIHEAAILMEFRGSSEDLARTCHAHPTLSEAIKEAAMAVEKRQIHM
jgi:dihydrolipoamide dehydrogenase